MKAKSPFDGKFYYFVDKCLPFGAAISCAIFQAFSDALAHITAFRTSHQNINYLDDFFFLALEAAICNWQLKIFSGPYVNKLNSQYRWRKQCGVHKK